MSAKTSAIEALEIYRESDLDEIISEVAINNFLSAEQPKKLVLDTVVHAAKSDDKKSVTPPTISLPISSPNFSQEIAKQTPIAKTASSFVNPFFSTSDAISALAKKTQNLQAQNLQSSSSVEQSISLKEIVEQAKKMAQAAQNLDQLRKAVESFDGCGLKKMATNTVFSDGNAQAKVMLIGEAPGNNEDLQGIPFCGDSGKVLDAMFNAIGMSRANDLYITNTIFWRPPGNRKPTEEELAICRPFVERHIELMKPKVIVLIGATAVESILKIHEPISKIRGQINDFAPDFLSQPTKTFAIFHPSYLMRQSSKKKVAWLDMLVLQKFLER